MNTAEDLMFAPGRSPRRGGIETIRGRIQDSPLQCAHPSGDGLSPFTLYPSPFTVRSRAWGWSARPPYSRAPISDDKGGPAPVSSRG